MHDFLWEHEQVLYKEFGINAELIIDHAWGVETTTMEHIKSYRSSSHSLQTGQVLPEAYSYEKGELIVKEMADQLVLDMTEKKIMSRYITLYIGYDIASVTEAYEGDITYDYYGRRVPTSSHGGIKINHYTSSAVEIRNAVLAIYHQVVNRDLLIRRVNIGAMDIKREEEIEKQDQFIQINLFEPIQEHHEKEINEEERKLQQTLNSIRKKYGKNAVIKLMYLEEGGKQKERNEQIGGHRA